MASIKNIQSINKACAQALIESGVRTTEQLIEAGSTSTDRMKLADETHLTHELVKEWVHKADLFRIKGMSGEHVELLCGLGYCTVPKIAYLRADDVFNELDNTVLPEFKGNIPTIRQLEAYINSAKKLPKVIHH